MIMIYMGHLSRFKKWINLCWCSSSPSFPEMYAELPLFSWREVLTWIRKTEVVCKRPCFNEPAMPFMNMQNAGYANHTGLYMNELTFLFSCCLTQWQIPFLLNQDPLCPSRRLAAEQPRTVSSFSSVWLSQTAAILGNWGQLCFNKKSVHFVIVTKQTGLVTSYTSKSNHFWFVTEY